MKPLSIALISFVMMSGCASMVGDAIKTDEYRSYEQNRTVEQRWEDEQNARDVQDYYEDTKMDSQSAQSARDAAEGAYNQ